MTHKAVLDSRLWIRHDLGVAYEKNTAFGSNLDNLGWLATQFMLYDKLVIPTNDFGIVPVLRNWMGERNLQEAIESDALGFVWLRDMIGYAGGGNGVCTFIIEDRAKPFDWYTAALFRPMGDALELQLRHGWGVSDTQKLADWTHALIKASEPAVYEEGFIDLNVIEETYRDIRFSEELTRLVRRLHPQWKRRSVKNLLEDGKVRVLSQENINHSADVVLRVAEINFELALAERCGGIDLASSEGAEAILRSKIARIHKGTVPSELFGALMSIESVPDFQPMLKADPAMFDVIWKLRNTTEGRQFRAWMRDVDAQTTLEIQQAYLAKIRERPLLESLPVKAIRLLATTGLGLLSSSLGLIGSGVDSFLLQKMFAGFSPRLYLDGVRRLHIEPSRRTRQSRRSRKL